MQGIPLKHLGLVTKKFEFLGPHRKLYIVKTRRHSSASHYIKANTEIQTN